MIKMVVSRYINSGSKVYGCFLDASKAFDRVDHGLLFQKLMQRGLPPPILNFLLSITEDEGSVKPWLFVQ